MAQENKCTKDDHTKNQNHFRQTDIVAPSNQWYSFFKIVANLFEMAWVVFQNFLTKTNIFA